MSHRLWYANRGKVNQASEIAQSGGEEAARIPWIADLAVASHGFSDGIAAIIEFRQPERAPHAFFAAAMIHSACAVPVSDEQPASRFVTLELADTTFSDMMGLARGHDGILCEWHHADHENMGIKVPPLMEVFIAAIDALGTGANVSETQVAIDSVVRKHVRVVAENNEVKDLEWRLRNGWITLPELTNSQRRLLGLEPDFSRND